MIIDGRTLPEGAEVEADVCVVGAGPAGISLALRIARESRLRICLLESGGLEFEEPTQQLARGETSGLPYFPLHETRIRALGGSTISWGGVCSPLDPMAFMRRSWVTDAGWPIDASDLEPYLDDALSLCEVPEAVRRRTTDDLAERVAGTSFDRQLIEPGLVFFSRPTRFGRAYRQQLELSRNIRVCLHSTVTELEVGSSRDGITGVRVRTGHGRGFTASARYFVLAAGGVENPRLLLASNRIMSTGIGNARDVVGRYFMEHPRARTRYRVQPGSTPLGRFVGGGAAGTLRFMRAYLSPWVQEHERLMTFHANLQFGYVGQLSTQWESVRRLAIASRRPWNESPYYQDAGGGRMRVRSADVLEVLRRPDRAAISAFAAVSEHPALRRFLEVYASTEHAPSRECRIELLPGRDALGVPVARVHWTVGELEERTYRRGLEILLRELERLEPGLGGRRLDEADPWPGQLEGTWHHLGGTRMHGDPAHGVVDRDCRVHDMDNLYVAGGSVFATSGSTSPTCTIVQLALRLADHLTGRLS